MLVSVNPVVGQVFATHAAALRQPSTSCSPSAFGCQTRYLHSRTTSPLAQRPCGRPQPRCRAGLQVRAAAAAAEVALTTRQAELKTKLLEAIGGREYVTGELPAALQGVLKELQEAAEQEPPDVSRGITNGVFKAVFNSTNYLDENRCTTLGTLTFQQFAPQDLKIEVFDTILVQGVDSGDSYSTQAAFKVVEGELEGLEGVQTVLGDFSFTDPEHPTRQKVTFKAIRIDPKEKSGPGFERWVAALKEKNPSMGEDGGAQIDFPQHMPAFRDFLLADRDYQVTVGNRGSFVGVQRI